VHSLLSECRFGFTQALREWPENTQARAGLTRCIEAMAQHEISQGNLVAARALFSELANPPAELASAMAELEKSAAESKRRHARLEQLSQEMDPNVAQRQRALVFAVTVISVAFTAMIPPAQFERFGTWNLTVRMLMPVLILAMAIALGRRSLLSTRLNRRLIGMVASAALGTLAQRVLGGALAFSNRETLLHNFLMVLAVCVTGGITLHWGFFWSAGAMIVGLLVAVLVPGYESPLFNLSAAGALIFSVLSWRGWRGEFSVRR
jgi:cation transport ATPase